MLLIFLYTILNLVRALVAPNCKYNEISIPIASLLCQVEKGTLTVKLNFPDDRSMCLLGTSKCNAVRRVPKESEVSKVEKKPVADNKEYQALSLIAEKEVPITWWREGFSDPQLLLTPTQEHLPARLFSNPDAFPNKRIKNIANCLCRQNVIRAGFGINETETDSKKDKKNRCNAQGDAGVQAFFSEWSKDAGNYGGKLDNSGMWRLDIESPVTIRLYEGASQTINYFIENAGGIWTGCIKVAKSKFCKGALSAAALLQSIRILHDVTTSQLSVSEVGSQLTLGFMFASMGRSLLHGSYGDSYTFLTSWHVRLSDFTALQSAFLRLYISSFGKQYNSQLNQYIPQAFPPSFSVTPHELWKKFSHEIEPVYTSLRNWMFTEARNLIDFGPYQPLLAFQEARDVVRSTKKRRVLIDVGANGFLASPKYLIDSYAIYLPFTHIIMVEPEPHFSATVPTSYSNRYNITFLQIYAEVATGSETDMMRLIPRHVTADDYVVLKFDVDPNRFAKGPTMEWGFLFALMKSKEVVALVDEIYIELHFHFPDLDWAHYHSNWEGLDVFRYLRDNGIIVHCWP